MRVLIEIDCDGAAFEGVGLYLETRRVLDKAATIFANMGETVPEQPLFDENGNRCGTLRVEE